MEAVFLAKRAGFETVVIDRKAEAPALSICDEPHVLNPLESPEEAKAVLQSCDAVIPACEELDLLRHLDATVPGMGIPLMFDLNAYNTSCSKNRSNEIMQRAGVPLPQPWPECGFPVIVKPSSQSGSIGVKVAFNDEDIRQGLDFIKSIGDEPVMQEFVHGKSVSIEVIGDGTRAVPYVTTEVVLDSNYDCKMVRCNPSILSEEDEEIFSRVGKDVAESIGLRALMDVEAILTPKGLRVLEIDARIPSQTPAAILVGTGVNLLDELYRMSTGKGPGAVRKQGCSVYRHVYMKDGVLRSSGEKVFGHVRRPRMEQGLFGSDYSISDYEPGKQEWYATLMTSGRTEEEVDRRCDESIRKIMDECSVETFIDGSPEVI
jgi:pyrrolysine biosynthesis protein PylC